MASSNPFTPSFGKVPPHIAGRDEIISDMTRAFEEGVGDPNLSTVLVGPRGSGKTALLLHLASLAQARGWVAASASAVPGMLEDIEQRALEAAEHLVDAPGGARLTGLSIGQVVSAEWERAPEARANWRTRMTRLIEQLNARDVGLLITVDEVRVELGEMVQLASVYQHLVGEDRKVALVMAGLPAKVSALLSDDSVSFLRRACRYSLGRVGDADVEEALLRTVEEGGRSIGPEALDAAVAAAGGFPYMVQLVGFRMWGQRPSSPEISAQDARRGAELARRDLESRVLEATYYDLSRGDRRFLAAMLEDAGRPSALADVAARLGEGTNYASTYKRRLLELGVIGERGRGRVAFELPGFADYLAAAEGL